MYRGKSAIEEEGLWRKDKLIWGTCVIEAANSQIHETFIPKQLYVQRRFFAPAATKYQCFKATIYEPNHPEQNTK